MKKQVVLPGIAFTERPEPVDAGIRETGEQRSESAPPAAAEAMLQADGWPPMADMLHSLFVFEPTTPEPAPITVLGLDCGGARGPSPLNNALCFRKPTCFAAARNCWRPLKTGMASRPARCP